MAVGGWRDAKQLAQRRVVAFGLSLALVGAMTLAIGAWTTAGRPAGQGQLYLLPVLAAGALLGRGPAVLAALASFLAFNWFFVSPVHTLTVADAGEWQALLLYLAVALVTGELTAQLRGRAETANRREREAVALYEVGQALAAAGSLPDALAAAEEGLRRVLGGISLELVLAEEGGPRALRGGELGAGEAAVVAWVVEHGQSAERGTEGVWHRRVRVRGRAAGGELRGADGLYLPLIVEGRCRGVVRVTGRGGARFNQAEKRLLTSAADQLAQALDRARLQRQMVRTEVQRRTDELRSALLLAVSHDFRTPLASIKAAAGSVAGQGERTDEAARVAAAAQIEREADRLNRLVENLLGLSRIEAGGLQLDRQWFPLRELVDDTAARLAGVLVGRRLVVDIPDDLPPVPLDYVLVQQVLVNLVDNAAKHTPLESEIRVEARLVEAGPGDASEVVVRVVDTGPGVPALEHERVFAPFYRLPRSGEGRRSASRGSGYGLAVCAGFVTAHGGRIWVEDAPEGGAVFAFTLPLTAPPGSAASVETGEPSVSAEPPADTSSEESGRKVVVRSAEVHRRARRNAVAEAGRAE